MARPTKLTPEVQERIAQAIRAGATYEHAAQSGGITYETFRKWRARGDAELSRVEEDGRRSVRADEADYVAFSVTIEKAEAEGVLTNLLLIRKAAQGDENNRAQWQAAAWLLERRHPEKYGRRIVDGRVDVTHTPALGSVTDWRKALGLYVPEDDTGAADGPGSA